MADTLRFNHWQDVRPEQWPLTFFDAKEVADSRDGSIVLHVPFGMRIDALRKDFGAPIRVNSWYRTPEHDRSIGGKGNHSGGWAADIRPVRPTAGQFWELARLAFDFRFHGIGFNPPSFIHLDDSLEYLAQGKRPAVWKYS